MSSPFAEKAPITVDETILVPSVSSLFFDDGKQGQVVEINARCPFLETVAIRTHSAWKVPNDESIKVWKMISSSSDMAPLFS
tara:strand:- start:42791 stop:43036 length:246 start_codon:yes stop_codon:yes gene_type:complete